MFFITEKCRIHAACGVSQTPINVMNLKGISSYAQGLVIGIVIIAMVLFDTCSKRKQESKAT